MSNEQILWFIRYLLCLGIVLLLAFFILKLLKKSSFMRANNKDLMVISSLKIDNKHSVYLLNVLEQKILFIASSNGGVAISKIKDRKISTLSKRV